MQKIFTLLIIGCAVVFFSNTADAADGILTWNDIVAKTLELQPNLKQASLRVDEARYDERISKSSLFPQVTGTSIFRRTKDSSSEWGESYSHTLSGSLLLFDGLKTPYAVKAARKKISGQKFAYDVVSSDDLLEVRTAFIGLMESQEFIQLTERIRDRKRQNLDMVKLRYEGGKEHKGAYLTAQAELAEAEFDVREAERGLILSQRKLLIAMGTEEMRTVSVTDQFSLSESYVEKPDLNKLLDDIPFLQELAAAKEEAMYSDRSSRGNFWPTVSAITSLGRSGKNLAGDTDSLTAGLSISIPLFEGGKNLATYKKSHGSFLLAQATEQSGRQQILLSLENNWKDLKDAIETVDVRKKFLDATEERAKISDAQYGTGLISFDDWTIIENNLVSAQKNYLSAQAGMLTAEAGWIHSLGGTLNDEIY